MSFQKLGIKVYVKNSEGLDLQSFMVTFNDWIRDNAIPGVLIDVADYTHMHKGPGVVLVSHEANWALDNQAGEPGMLVSWKLDREGSLDEKIQHVHELVTRACDLIEKSSRHQGVQFDRSWFKVFVNDRLNAPANEESYQQLEKALEKFVASTFKNQKPTFKRNEDLRKRVAVSVRLKA